MKKVLFYTDTPIYGGAERHMLLLAKNLPREKYEVQLACSAFSQFEEWHKGWKEAGLKVHKLKVAHKHDPRHLSQLKKVLKTERPDIVHLHLWNPGACRYAFSAVDKGTSKLVTTEHNPFPLRGIKRTFKKNCLKKTDRTITVSEDNKKLMLELYPELKNRLTTIHNGIDLDNFGKSIIHYSTQDRKKIREGIIGADNGDFVVLSVAQLHPQKGLHHLLEAFALLAAKKQNVKLAIAGDGPQKKVLEKLIKKLHLDGKVKLLGYQKNIPYLLKSADLYVQPSINESFGMAIVEAMAAKLAVVATAVGGIPEIVEHNKSGILVGPRDVTALSQAMSDLIENDALREKMAYVGNHRVKIFDVGEMARKTGELYDQLLNL